MAAPTATGLVVSSPLSSSFQSLARLTGSQGALTRLAKHSDRDGYLRSSSRCDPTANDPDLSGPLASEVEPPPSRLS